LNGRLEPLRMIFRSCVKNSQPAGYPSYHLRNLCNLWVNQSVFASRNWLIIRLSRNLIHRFRRLHRLRGYTDEERTQKYKHAVEMRTSVVTKLHPETRSIKRPCLPSSHSAV